MGLQERIKEIEEEMARTQKNKATEHHLGMLKAKMAKLRRELIEPASKPGAKAEGFDVMKSGDARVAMIGFPSVGKSTLLTKLTSTESLAAAYEFTTLTCVPGKLVTHGATIQLLDLPGIIEGASEGRGRGRQVIAVARTADMILMMLEASKGEVQRRLLERELENVGIRLNKERPNIYFKRKATGGVHVNSMVPLTRLNDKTIKTILHEYKIFNCELLFRDDCDADDLIDVVEGNRMYLKCLYVYNKIDTVTIPHVDYLARQPNSVVLSCQWNLNLDTLVEEIWNKLKLVRVYTKPQGRQPDFGQPFILRNNCTVEHFCHCIHRSLVDHFKYAMVWGRSAKHNPQRVGLAHELSDEDVVQVVKT